MATQCISYWYWLFNLFYRYSTWRRIWAADGIGRPEGPNPKEQTKDKKKEKRNQSVCV